MFFQQRVVIRNPFDKFEDAHLDVKHPQAVHRIGVGHRPAAKILDDSVRILGVQQRASVRGMALAPEGLRRGRKILAASSKAEIYSGLDLQYIEILRVMRTGGRAIVTMT